MAKEMVMSFSYHMNEDKIKLLIFYSELPLPPTLVLYNFRSHIDNLENSKEPWVNATTLITGSGAPIPPV